jgi:hypothetical protein
MVSLLLYSANTQLAYKINQKYYNQKHYVYCCPYYDPRQLGDLEQSTPPSSSPCELLRDFSAEATRDEGHSKFIKQNRAGLRRGAATKFDTGVITLQQRDDILHIVSKSKNAAFRPLLYVVPYHVVSARIRPVAVTKRAHPFSEEYIIDDLDRSEFDVWDLETR